jgi:PDZ domain-containing secreted protein
LLVSLPLILAAIALIVLVIIVVVFLLFVLSILMGIPYYFLKKGQRSEEGRYDLAEVKSIKEDEKK